MQTVPEKGGKGRGGKKVLRGLRHYCQGQGRSGEDEGEGGQ